MDFFTENVTIILLLPFLTFCIILSGLLFKHTKNIKIPFLLTLFSTITGLVFSFGILHNISVNNTSEKFIKLLSCPYIDVNIGTYTDSVSAIFLAVFMLCTLFIQIYAFGYMKDNIYKSFLMLNLFNFSFIGLILSPNFIQFFIFSLIATIALFVSNLFFKETEEKNKVGYIYGLGELFLLIGIFMFIFYMNLLPNPFLNFNKIDVLQNMLQNLSNHKMYYLLISFPICYSLIKIFSIGDSASIKLHIPFYSMIKVIFPVFCGIFFLIRIHSLFTHNILIFITFMGIIAALVFSLLAYIQNNLKKMMSYIISSLAGLIMIAAGYSSVNTVIISSVVFVFTLSLLSLSAGNIYKTYENYEIENISGINKTDYFLSFYLIVAALSVSGLFLGGFTSKEIILGVINNKFLLFAVLFVFFINSYTIFKVYFKLSEGENMQVFPFNTPSMTIALRTLCIFVILPGFLLNISKLNLLTFISTVICLLGVLSAYFDNKTGKELIVLYPLKKFITRKK